MRFFFEIDNSSWAKRMGIQYKWQQLIGEWSKQSGSNTVTLNREDADVIIRTPIEQLGLSKFTDLIQPLSRSDVQSLVLDWQDHPTGRISGFYSALDRLIFDKRRHRTIHYPIEINDPIDAYALSDAVFDYGFLGGMNGSLRQKIFYQLAATPKDNSYFKMQGLVWSPENIKNNNTPEKMSI